MICFSIAVSASTRGALRKEIIREGKASYYGKAFHNKVTYSGERYNMHALTAAHWLYPMGTILEVTNKSNGKKVIVRVNDSGAFKKKYSREIDLSKAAFSKIANINTGIIKVSTKVIKLGDGKNPG